MEQQHAPAVPKEAPMPLRVRWFLYLMPWGAAVVSTLSKNPKDLLTAYGLPVGLLAALPLQQAMLVAWLAGLAAILAGWALYGVLTFVIFSTKRTSVFWWTYIIFFVLLACNLAGCRKMIAAASGIQ
jgi:hypothetical protein